MKTPLLELKDIGFAYEDSPHALEGVSLAIYPGDRIAVLGRNGAGKSTFFLCCNGVNIPEHGHIFLNGTEVSRRKKDLFALRKAVGVVFQDPNQQLIGSTVEGEVSFGPMNLRLEREEVLRRVNSAMDAMNVAQFRERPPHYLSGGEKKRVSIADVLAMESEIILFDEPTASLDPANTAALETVLHRLGEAGKTLVVSTHDVDFAWRWANRVLLFEGGRLIADDTPEAVFSGDTLPESAGLALPWLVQTARVLAEKGLFPPGASYPKSLGALKALL